MFGIGGGEFLALIILAVLLFGPEKLPDLARKLARVVTYLRRIANNAQSSIQAELGPGFEDFDIRDPRGFVRRHVLAEVEPIVADVRSELDESAAAVRQARAQLQAETGHRSEVKARPQDQPVLFDSEAT